MKISIFIPTIPNHIKYLDKLFHYIYDSTVIPDEVIMSVSDYNKCDKNIINTIENKYKINIIKHDKIMLAGPNRQVSKDSCFGDIIMYQDADDLPHRQRVEIVKYFFEKYDIVHLNHSYLPNNTLDFKIDNYDDIKMINSQEIFDKYFPSNVLENCINYCGAYGSGFNLPFHAGVPCIKKEVLDVVKWKDRDELTYSPSWNIKSFKGAEDYEFCMETLYHFNKSILIDSKIYSYTT